MLFDDPESKYAYFRPSDAPPIKDPGYYVRCVRDKADGSNDGGGGVDPHGIRNVHLVEIPATETAPSYGVGIIFESYDGAYTGARP